MNRRPVTLIDVARAANVSIATVSRALSFPEKVSRETLARIERSIENLGYVANGSARALASRRSRTIGALIPSLDNPSFATTVHALQRALGQSGYAVLLACHEFDPAAERRLAHNLLERGVDGLVLLGTEHQPELYELIERFRLPCVLTWALEHDGAHPCVGFDNRAAAARLTEHLLAMGHRVFAMISGTLANNERARERARGVREALRGRGLELGPGRFVEMPYTLHSGREGLARVLERSPPPTAVICGNDLLAIGAIAECHARGLDVPQDVSVTGFDDMEIGAMLSPGLTTVHFPAQELGALAAQQILHAIAGEPLALCLELPVRLVVRGTTGPPKATQS